MVHYSHILTNYKVLSFDACFALSPILSRMAKKRELLYNQRHLQNKITKDVMISSGEAIPLVLKKVHVKFHINPT